MNRLLASVSVAAALLLSPVPAYAAPTCVTEREFKAGMAFFVPALVRAARAKCEATLGQSSYLVRRGDDFAARFRAADVADPPALESLFKKVKLGKDMPEAANLAAMEALREVVAVKLANDLKVKACTSVDCALELLDPLPPANWTGLLAMIGDEFTRADVKKGKKPPFLICGASS